MSNDFKSNNMWSGGDLPVDAVFNAREKNNSYEKFWLLILGLFGFFGGIFNTVFSEGIEQLVSIAVAAIGLIMIIVFVVYNIKAKAEAERYRREAMREESGVTYGNIKD